MKVIIASKNPVKIQAVQNGFMKMFEQNSFEFKGVSVPSDVSDQPMTDEETLRGARNRVSNAYADDPDADYWVGVEGGIETFGKDMLAFAWIVIKNKEQTGRARTCAFLLPPKVSDLVMGGMELGDADDIVFGQNNSKQKSGAVGLLTQNRMDRAGLYTPAVVLALIPFKNKELYI